NLQRKFGVKAIASFVVAVIVIVIVVVVVIDFENSTVAELLERFEVLIVSAILNEMKMELVAVSDWILTMKLLMEAKERIHVRVLPIQLTKYHLLLPVSIDPILAH